MLIWKFTSTFYVFNSFTEYIQVRKPCLDYTLNTRVNIRMLQILVTKYTNNALSFGELYIFTII